MRHTILMVIALLGAGTAFGRPVRTWTYEELFKAADFVAVVEVVKIKDTAAKLDGHSNTALNQGKRAELKVGLVLKGDKQKTVFLNFFVGGAAVLANGARFADFSKSDKAHYLVFLKRNPDGSFGAVSGDYDAESSVRAVESNSLIKIEKDPTKN